MALLEVKNLCISFGGLKAVDDFSVSISFRNPRTNELETNVSCIIPTDTVEYYTIQVGKVMYKAFVLQFIEL